MAEMKARHAHVVREYEDSLEERGEHVLLEMQDWFESRNSESCSPTVGRPDMIGRDADGDIKVYDVKTSQPRAADEIHVKLCTCCCYPARPTVAGRVRTWPTVDYIADGTEVPTSSDSIDGEVREQVAGVMRRIVSEVPARRVQS